MPKAIWGLENTPLFKGLTANDIQAVTQIVRKVRYKRGDIITDQSSKSRDVFVLMDGHVDIISLTGMQLYRISKGETFGELALVNNLKRTAMAVAREDSWVMVLNMNHLEAFGEEYPMIYGTISANLVTSLGVKLARANKLIELLKSELTRELRK